MDYIAVNEAQKIAQTRCVWTKAKKKNLRRDFGMPFACSYLVGMGINSDWPKVFAKQHQF